MANKVTKRAGFVIATALLVSACASISSRETVSREQPRRLSVLESTRGWSVSPPLSISDIERENPTLVPPVASRNSDDEKWKAFKTLIRPGDRLYFLRFMAWTGTVGLSELLIEDSYVIVRDDIIVAELVVGTT